MVNLLLGNNLAAGLDSDSIPDALGRTATIRTAEMAYAIAGSGGDDIDLAEGLDRCVSNEVMVCSTPGFFDEDGRRQVRPAWTALEHNLGIGGPVSVSILQQQRPSMRARA